MRPYPTAPPPATTVAPQFGEGRLYRFTSENLCEYLPSLIQPNSRVLTVAASGDHCLNAVLLGAREVTLFDTAYLSLCWSACKVACVQHLTYREFLAIMLPSRQGVTAAAITELLRRSGEGIPRDLRAVLQDQAASIQERFKQHHDRDELVVRCNRYLQSEKQYQQLKVALSDTTITYCHQALADVAAACNRPAYARRWDTILLSNIADYCHFIYGHGATGLAQYVRSEVAPLLTALSPQGNLAAAYRYNITSSTYRSAIDNPHQRLSAFAPFHPIERAFPGLIPGTSDGISLLYRNHQRYVP